MWRALSLLLVFWSFFNTSFSICQQHTALSSSETRRVLGELERSISEVEAELVGQGNVGLQANLTEIRRDLGSFVQVKDAQGDGCSSSFFFGLEKQSGEAENMHCLRLSHGRVTSVVGEMRSVEFYTELYRAELCDPMCAQVLFAELRKLSLAQREEIDISVTRIMFSMFITQFN